MAEPRLDDPLTIEQLHTALDYDPDTGIFTWRHRPDRSGQWNGKWAGKQAGGIHVGGVSINLAGRLYKAHRLVWRLTYGEWPAGDIDHINGDWRDNRITNLRLASRSQNNANKRISRNNKSGFKGVHQDKKDRRWVAQIVLHDKYYYLGRFGTPEEAHAAYCDAAVRLQGEFARFK